MLPSPIARVRAYLGHSTIWTFPSTAAARVDDWCDDMRRACLVLVIGIVGLCVLACAGGYFVALPRARDRARDDVRDAFSTEVAAQIPRTNGSVKPGSYTLTQAELQQDLLANLSSSRVNDIAIAISPTGIRFGVTADGGQETTYTGVPVAEAGKLKMTQMDTSSGVLELVFPADDLGKAIEDSVNGYLAENNLTLSSLTLGDGKITLHVAASS
jgi:hypothetical protein